MEIGVSGVPSEPIRSVERRASLSSLPDWAFGVLLVGFIGTKAAYLGLPYYWDEAWVYAPAIHTMHASGPSLLPDDIGTALSRGHPLMFHFLGSLWISVFGPSRESSHAFVLVTAVILLIFMYRWVAKLSGKWSGLASAAIVGGNEAFLAQSGILLPETLLALFALISFAAYHSDRPWVYVIASSVCVLTKESGVVIVLALVCWHLYAMARDAVQGSDQRRRWTWLYVLLVPAFVLSSFLFYQRVRFGWFLFPEHTQLVSLNLKDVIYKLKLCHAFLFERNGMEAATYAFAFIFPLAWRGWNRWWFLIAGVALVAAIKVLYGRWGLPLGFTIPAVLASLFLYQALFLEKLRMVNRALGAVVSSGLACIVAFSLFSAVNFYTERYLLCLIPMIAVVFVPALEFALRDYPKPVFAGVALCILIPIAWSIGEQNGIKDVNLNYADDIRARQRVIRLCESMGLYDDPVAGSFLEQYYMTDPLIGYLSGMSLFTNVQSSVSADTQYAVVSSATTAEDLARAQRYGLKVLNVQVSGSAWCALVGRTTTQTAAPPPVGSSPFTR